MEGLEAHEADTGSACVFRLMLSVLLVFSMATSVTIVIIIRLFMEDCAFELEVGSGLAEDLVLGRSVAQRGFWSTISLPRFRVLWFKI